MIANYTASEHCPWCLDDAQVCVGTNAAGMEQMAPCPKCERGDRLEHGSEYVIKGRDGRRTVKFPRKPPWGRDGYWQGRQHELEPPAERGEPLSAAENKRRFAAMVTDLQAAWVERDREQAAALKKRQHAKPVDPLADELFGPSQEVPK